MFRLTAPLKALQMQAFQQKNRLFERAFGRYFGTRTIRPYSIPATINQKKYSPTKPHYQTQTSLTKRHSAASALQTIDNDSNMLQIAFGLQTLQKPKPLPQTQKFFVYGTLRDDDNSNALWTKDFTHNCVSENAKLFGFKMFRSHGCKFPFAVKSSNKNDYIIGRLIHWNESSAFFQQKLATADWIEGYDSDSNQNMYNRDVLSVSDTNGNATQAFVYHRNEVNMRSDKEIMSGDWLQRNAKQMNVPKVQSWDSGIKMYESKTEEIDDSNFSGLTVLI